MKPLAESRGRVSKPEISKKFVPGRTVAYMFVPESMRKCNSSCTGCYVLASESYKNRVDRTEEKIISDLRALAAKGYSILASTTEVLLLERYPEVLQAIGATTVLTNGKIIVANPEILLRLKEIGIEQIVLTANFSNSGLKLTEPDFFKEALRAVRYFGLKEMVRITLTKQNLPFLQEMVGICNSLGISCIQFLRFMPVSQGPETVNEADAKKFFRMLELLRAQYPDIYLSAGGSLGSQFRKKRFSCPAGKSQFLIGLDNGIYPCIYLTQKENQLGRFENGELFIERTFDPQGNQLECPAYRYYLSRSKNEKVLEK